MKWGMGLPNNSRLSPKNNMPKKPSTKKKQSTPRSGSNPFPYRKARVRIPREVESASSLWLDFFQQFSDSTIADSPGTTGDQLAIGRARILADYALAAFQERFPGVHP